MDDRGVQCTVNVCNGSENALQYFAQFEILNVLFSTKISAN